jgi:acyl-CoA synthetase (AMP-forming)/AMP-acid ligase II
VAGNDSLSKEEIRRALKVRLPEYMLPNVILLYAALPKNPNGKVDKKALAAKFSSENA